MITFTRSAAGAVVLAVGAMLQTAPVLAADELLETLAQKGVISAEEYQKLKDARKSNLNVATDDGFKISSGDGANTLQVGVLQQIDYAGYDVNTGPDIADGTDLRRSRISVGGVFLKDWQYRVEYEFSNSTGTTNVTDAYVAYTALKPVTITVGNFKTPLSLEALVADKNATFMERGLPFAFVNVASTRLPGIMIGSSGEQWTANVGVFGEALNATQSGDEGYGFAGRATYAPIIAAGRVVHLGVSASWRNPTADNFTDSTGKKFPIPTVQLRSKPESNELSQRLVDTGNIPGVVDDITTGVLEFAAQNGAASVQGEYFAVQVARDTLPDLDFSGWYAQVAYTLTGEARPYRADKAVFDGIRPAKSFGKDGWGAWEVAFRLSGIDLTDGTVIGGKERNATFGVNAYLNSFVRVSANVVKVQKVEGGAFDGVEPTIYQMRVQLAY